MCATNCDLSRTNIPRTRPVPNGMRFILKPGNEEWRRKGQRIASRLSAFRRSIINRRIFSNRQNQSWRTRSRNIRTSRNIRRHVSVYHFVENDYIITAVTKQEQHCGLTGRFIIVHLILVQSVLVSHVATSDT